MAVAVSLFAGPVRADVGADVEAFTGARTRMVWVQDQSAANADTLALGRDLKLMGFDSRDGKGERAILGDVKNFAKPMLTSDGERVVFSDRYAKQAFVVNWDGSGLRRVGAGYAVEVWTDPDGKTWVYLCNQVGAIDSINFKSLRRVRLGGGRGRPEAVWEKGEISPDNFQLSADGTHAGGEFPWPHGGVFDVTAKTWRKCADGCWASMAPDNSYLSWVFDGPHRNIYLYPPNGGAGWKVPLNTAPETEGFEVFHPRWSNHVRYLAATGPYKVKIAAVNTIAGGGPEVEAYIGRFSDDYHKIDSWMQVTHNKHGDFHPDVWIADGAKSSIDPAVLASVAAPAPKTDRWPSHEAGLVFVWDNAAAENVIPGDSPRPCRVEARGHAKFERFFDMDCKDGAFSSEAGPAVSAACRASGELTLEAAITPARVPQSGPARIITLATNVNSRNFTLSQDRDTLVLELHTRSEKSAHRTVFRLGKLTAGRQLHLVLAVANGKVLCCLDGKEQPLETTYPGDFHAWTDGTLVFGEDVTGKSNWEGRLEAIALYDRALSAEAAAKQHGLFAARLADRKPIEPLRLRLKCVETSPIPDPRSIVPYRRALVLNRFQVEKVLQGKFEGRELIVGQWGILDKAVMAEAQLRVGQTIDLSVEPFDQHPELKSERQIVELEQLEGPWFYAKD